MRALALSLILSISTLYGLSCQAKTIMLVLGSADVAVLDERIDIALRLYAVQDFDAVIVSGGCGAHGSSICEASRMFDRLTANGVPEQLIIKEENAKTTVQNYVFSRQLKDAHGAPIIQKGDSLYIVSNHWHAIAVAARFAKYDAVTARYFVEGAIAPMATARVDYVDILHGEEDNDTFVLKGHWLTADASWNVQDTTYYLMGNLLYSSNADNSVYAVKRLKEAEGNLKNMYAAAGQQYIDEGDAWWIWDGTLFKNVEKYTGKLRKQCTWEELLPDTPSAWRHSLRAGFIYEGTMYLFSSDKLLIANRENTYFLQAMETSADQYFKGWPFGWGKGNVSGASFDAKANAVTLFRNMEQLTLQMEQARVMEVKPLRLKWITKF